MKKHFGKRVVALLASAAILATGTSVLPAFADAGEKLDPISDSERKFPDPSTLEEKDVNFAKALQLSMYFYDANKCGKRTGRLEWRNDCHMEDAQIPLIPMTEKKRGTNLSQKFIDKNKAILDPDGDGLIDLEGGMHDAGDHVKFGLPGTYAASTLGWGYYEFRDAYKDSGQQEHIEDILHYFNDFYLKCLYYDEGGEDVLAFCYQVGEGNIDHNYWVCPDLQGSWLLDFERPAYFATKETPASDMCAGAAASLAVNYLNFKDTEPEYAEESLKAAKALYKFAKESHTERKVVNTGSDKPAPTEAATEAATEATTKPKKDGEYDPDNPDDVNKKNENTTMEVTSLGFDGGFYTSSYDYDELSWAAVWLYYCTEDYDYITDIIDVDESVTYDNGGHPYKGWIRRIITDTGRCWQNIWVHCWDTVWGGVFAKLAPVTNIRRDWYIFRWNLEFWSGMNESELAANKKTGGLEPAVTMHKYFGLDDELWNTKITAKEIKGLKDAQGAYLAKTPAGFGMLNEYGSCRYNTAAQLCALVYAKETGDDVFVNWCAGQMGYICGNNPMGRSYIVGYDLKDGACHPHHRAAHGSTTQNMDDPVDQQHVLWGALVGGPDKTDWHRDITKDYVYNEVAVDYNAGFVGACAGLYYYIGKERGDKPEKNFPPSEQELNGGTPITEFTLKAAVGREDDDSTQVLIEIDNHTSLPPRYLDGIDVRFYFNISEMLEAGYKFEDFLFSPQYDSLSSNTNGESEVTYEVKQYNDKGDCYVNLHWPKSKFYGKEQYQFALVNAAYVKIWDSSNDYSTGNIPKAEDLGLEIGKAPQLTDYCTMYVDGKQVWGIAPEDAPQPDYIDPDATQPATHVAAEQNTVTYGDVNCDKAVDILDVIALNKYLLGLNKPTEQGIANADVDLNKTVDSNDALNILRAALDLIKLPVKAA